VVFALIGSFVLSRTLVSTMAFYLLHASGGHRRKGACDSSPEYVVPVWSSRLRNGLLVFQQGFETRFTEFRERYSSLLGLALGRPKMFIAGFLVVVLLSLGLTAFLGQNFFPSIDSGQILMHVRAQTGTRIEETARLCDFLERTVRQIIPPAEVDNIVDNIGLPISGINLAYSNTGTSGPEDADVLISLKEGHAATASYVKKLRTELPKEFPGTTFAFLPADIVSQILNFGYRRRSTCRSSARCETPTTPMRLTSSSASAKCRG
jgi:multidrug efflux pump subunit AcrB